MRNLQEQVKKAFCYQKLFWPFTVWINFSSDLKIFANSRPSASNFKTFSRSLEQFFLTVGQNNFGNKIPMLAIWILYIFPFLSPLKMQCNRGSPRFIGNEIAVLRTRVLINYVRLRSISTPGTFASPLWLWFLIICPQISLPFS